MTEKNGSDIVIFINGRIETECQFCESLFLDCNSSSQANAPSSNWLLLLRGTVIRTRHNVLVQAVGCHPNCIQELKQSVRQFCTQGPQTQGLHRATCNLALLNY